MAEDTAPAAAVHGQEQARQWGWGLTWGQVRAEVVVPKSAGSGTWHCGLVVHKTEPGSEFPALPILDDLCLTLILAEAAGFCSFAWQCPECPSCAQPFPSMQWEGLEAHTVLLNVCLPGASLPGLGRIGTVRRAGLQ